MGVVTSNGRASMPSRSAAVEGLARAMTAEATQKSASQPTVIRRVARMPCPPRAAKAPATGLLVDVALLPRLLLRGYSLPGPVPVSYTHLTLPTNREV